MKEIDRGTEGIVFENNGHATKVFFSQRKLNKKTTVIGKLLSHINFERFMKPYNFKLNIKGIINTHDMGLLPEGKRGKFSSMNKNILVKELRLIRQDIHKMASSLILVRDMQYHNIAIIDGNIYFYDFSDYRLGKDKERTKIKNDNEMNDLFGSVGLQEENPDINPITIYDSFYSKFLRSGYSYIEDYIEDKVDTDTVVSYLKKR